jgi:regulatory factor X
MQLHEEDGEINLPDISQFCPPKTDEDAANALSTLYLTHVTSLVDCVRFCKEKVFFRLFTQFQGTLTVPVQKLLVHARIAPWVKECDYLMYQRMVKVIAPLTLQAIPPKVMKFLDTISKLLEGHVGKTFAALPAHLQDAKLEPATLFGQLLERMLRANQAAHAASMALTDDENRGRMWAEYARCVQPKSLMNAFLPDCGYDEEVYRLLTFDVRSLLLPLPGLPDVEAGTHYEAAAHAQRAMAQPPAFEIDRIGHFLEGLRARFPTVGSRDLLGFVHGVTGYVLRDVTMERGASYNGWLIAKCFVDELALWLAHAGGFLARVPPPPPAAAAEQMRLPPGGEGMLTFEGASAMESMMRASNGVGAAGSGSEASRRGSAALLAGSRASSGGAEYDSGSGAFDPHAGVEGDVQGMDLDDSGIGLSLDDHHQLDVKPAGAALAADLAALDAMASAAAEVDL